MYIKEVLFSLVALTSLSEALFGGYATNITDCPWLLPRFPPTSVHDLRPDDIKVIGALGDSVMTAYGAKDIDISKHEVGAIEYRGVSFAIGGDEGAGTLPNYFKRYQPGLYGYSLGKHEFRNCNFGLCIPRYEKNQDFLNAALGAAPVTVLDRQLTYLINEMRSRKSVNFEQDWKMITIQTASNNLCLSCSFYASESTPDKIEYYVGALLERIQAEIPRTIVNLVSAVNITEIFEADRSNNRCKDSGSPSKEAECDCGADKERGWKHMSDLSSAYNERLLKLYQKYQNKKNDTFAVIFQDMNLNYKSTPAEFYSNFDCYHPTTIGHKYMATILWNQLFLPFKDRFKRRNFNPNEPLYCPTSFDRIITS